MIVVPASAKIFTATPQLEELVEQIGRVCWKSEDRIKPGSAKTFIETLKSKKHESVLEHGAITVHIVCNRGVSHEFVRHRIASYSQESTRYCNYSKEKFGQELTYIDPRPGFPTMTADDFAVWVEDMTDNERRYMAKIARGWSPQQARGVLAHDVKTEFYITANPRVWRHVFQVRTDGAAHPQMCEITRPLLLDFAQTWPALFGDIQVRDGRGGTPTAPLAGASASQN